MSMFEYLCNSCGSFFDADGDAAEGEEPVECTVCHSHDTQVIPSLASVYGYSGSANSGCGTGDTGIR